MWGWPQSPPGAPISAREAGLGEPSQVRVRAARPHRTLPRSLVTHMTRLVLRIRLPSGVLQWARLDSNQGPTDYESAALNR